MQLTKKYQHIILLLVLIFSICFCSTKSKMQNQFEGKIIIEIMSNNETITTEYFIKDKKVKTTTIGNNSEIIMSTIKNGNKLFTLMAEQKMYMEMDYDLLKKSEELNNLELQDSTKEVGLLKYKTGKTKTILGYNCEQIIFEERVNKNVIWVTDEIGDVQNYEIPIGPNFSWGKSLSNKDYFALLFTTTDKDGEIVARIEIKSIDKTPLNDSVFTPPSDYIKMDMSKVRFD